MVCPVVAVAFARNPTPFVVVVEIVPVLVMLLALKLLVLSRLTMALAVPASVGGSFHVNPKVPVLVIGDPETLKSDAGAANATLFTVPGPVPGKDCPGAKVICPLPEILKPVSAGVTLPCPKSRFSVPEGVGVLLAAGSTCRRNNWLTEVEVELLKAEAAKVW